MNEIIAIKGNGKDFNNEIEKAGSKYPDFMRDSVKEAFQAANEEQYEEAAGICCKLLDYESVPEIRMLLGSCYFARGMCRARNWYFLT